MDHRTQIGKRLPKRVWGDWEIERFSEGDIAEILKIQPIRVQFSGIRENLCNL
jgi:hypothetical protein